VAFDLLFTEPSAHQVEDDLTFAAAITSAPPFVAALFLGRDTGNETMWPANLPPSRLKVSGLDKWLAKLKRKKGVLFPKASFPIPLQAITPTPVTTTRRFSFATAYPLK